MSDPDLPQAPPGTEELFGDRWAQAQEYARLLCTDGITRGIIGPREIPRIWLRHIRNSLAVAPLIPPRSTVIDLGSGGGLPGIPVALARPDLRVTLLDGMRRRIEFLRLARDRLALPLDIEHARAESARSRAQCVICRAVAPARELVPLAHQLIAGSGELLALKGESAADELERMQHALDVERRARWTPALAEVISVDWPDSAIVFRARWQEGTK